MLSAVGFEPTTFALRSDYLNRYAIRAVILLLLNGSLYRIKKAHYLSKWTDVTDAKNAYCEIPIEVHNI